MELLDSSEPGSHEGSEQAQLASQQYHPNNNGMPIKN